MTSNDINFLLGQLDAIRTIISHHDKMVADGLPMTPMEQSRYADLCYRERTLELQIAAARKKLPVWKRIFIKK